MHHFIFDLFLATHTDGQTVLFSESAAATNVISGGGDSSAVELIQISSLNELTGLLKKWNYKQCQPLHHWIQNLAICINKVRCILISPSIIKGTFLDGRSFK